MDTKSHKKCSPNSIRLEQRTDLGEVYCTSNTSLATYDILQMRQDTNKTYINIIYYYIN